MKIPSTLVVMLVAAANLMAVGNVKAVPVVVNAVGTVTEVDIPDVFGTQVGDLITMTAKFDSSGLVNIPSFAGKVVPGVQFASLSSPVASLSIDMRGQHWTAHDDSLFGLGSSVPLPQIILQFGKFVGLNFFGVGPQDNVFLNDARDSLYFGGPPGIIFGGNSDPDAPPFWIGFWDFSRSTVSVLIPEPTSLGMVLIAITFLIVLPIFRTKRIDRV